MANRPHIRTDGRDWAFVTEGAEIPLPAPTALKWRAIDEAYGENAVMRGRVVDLLEAFRFDYEVAPGKDSATWLLGVVVYTDDNATLLADIGDPVVHCFYGALSLAVRPADFEWNRVVACD